MKQLAMICLLLIGSLCISQELLLEKIVQLKHNTGDTINVRKYTYDNNYQLTQWYIGGYLYGDTTFYNYRNDTLIYRTDGFSYKYFNDSIVEYENNQINDIYYLNEAGEAIKSNNRTYQWSGGNMIRLDVYSSIEIWEHDSSYFNPWYNQNKNLKIGIRASGDMPFKKTHYQFPNFTLESYIVHEAIQEYPTIIEYTNNEYEYSNYYYLYYIDLTDISEHIIATTEVLSILYYNILGQEIEKPKHGFYIERKITNKGIISKKCYQY